MGDTLDSAPAQHLEMLLARAQNPFDVSDSVLERLNDAVLCQVQTHGLRHRNTPPPVLRCGSFRHAFLLADGTSLTLWELLHDGDNGPSYEIYECEEALRYSQERAHPRTGTPGGSGCATPEEYEAPAEWPPLFPEELPGAGEARAYTQENSADHARRLLRRAENADRPGEETLQRLADARGYEIVHMPRPHIRAGGQRVWCSLYEHAFLLPDGSEISLYELEHNLTRSGRLVCEVYLEEATADQAAQRLTRDPGPDLDL